MIRGIRRGIDWTAVKQLGQRYQAEYNDRSGPVKYFEEEFYLAQGLDRALALGLDRSRPQRILDIGTGFGYFLLAARYFGHDVLGLDFIDGNRPDAQCYEDVAKLFRIARTHHRIEKFHDLPRLAGPFDLVTAYAVCFDQHRSPQLWNVSEWSYFLADLSRYLSPQARLRFVLNEPDVGERQLSSPLASYFSGIGGRVNGLVVDFDAPPLVEMARR